jgi:hypothetical protein
MMLYTLLVYGIGTDFSNWFDVIERRGDVMAASQSYVHTVVWEQNNFWIGPRFVSLFFFELFIIYFEFPN